ncbi:hypothetical protein HFP72_24475 [Nocardiopsis sp. ARC36]
MTANLWTASNLAMEGEVVHEYEGFIGWVLSLMTTLGEPGVGVALFIETFFPRCRARRSCPVRASSPTTGT